MANTWHVIYIADSVNTQLPLIVLWAETVILILQMKNFTGKSAEKTIGNSLNNSKGKAHGSWEDTQLTNVVFKAIV